MKNKFFDRYLPLIPVALVLGAMMFSHSCANTTQAPTGGEKDSIPPFITNIVPYPGTVNVPVIGSKFAFTFNEYVNVKDVKNIVFSPPLKKTPKYRMKGKTVIIYYEEDTLKANTTYTIDFTDAIADVNQDNMFMGYTYMFSTGATLDSMMITGTVQDCESLMPVAGASVMLYKDHSDSALYYKKPDAITKTDQWGFFCLRNIQDTLFRLYAIKDEGGNNIFDPDADLVAFADTAIRPSTVASDDVYETHKFDMKDTLKCLSRKSEYTLNLFREKPSKQFLKNSGRMSDRSAFISFMAQDVHIDTMWMAGIPSDRLISQINIERDSIELWVNDKRRMPDTLHLFVNYRKTDSLGLLTPFTEEVKLIHPEAGKRNKRKTLADIKHEDTICVMNVKAEASLVEQEGVRFEFQEPIVYEKFDSIRFWSVNPKQQEEKMEFTVERDTLDVRVFHFKPIGKLLPGYEYNMKVPSHAFEGINGFMSDSLDTKFALPSDEKLSSIRLLLTGVHNKYIIDLLGEDRKTVKRTYVIEENTTLDFPYLSAGNYSIRVTEDRNRNSIVDSGSLLDHRQPEKVLFLSFGNDGNILKVEEMMEIQQDVNLEELF